MMQADAEIIEASSWKFKTLTGQLNPPIIAALEHRNYWQDILINNGVFLTHNLPQILQDVEECTHSKGLNLNNNMHSNIIHDIQHIRFASLQWLSLRDNNIVSIDSLPQIYMPQIKRLFLDSNNLTISQPLRKCHYPLMTQLQIHNNYFTDFENVAPSIMTRNIKQLGIEHPDNRHMVNRINFIAKLQGNYLNQIWIISPERIQTPKVYESLQRRYNNLMICRK